MKRLFASLAFVLSLLIPSASWAATCVWAGTTSVFATNGNWAGGTAPANGDTVYLPPTSSQSIAGANTGLTGIILIVDPGYNGSIGSQAAYLQIGVATSGVGLSFGGGGKAYIDVGSSAATLAVTATASSSGGSPSIPPTTSGLYLKGSAIGTLAVSGGSVALAGNDGETSTVTTVNVAGAGTSVFLGSGVTATTARVSTGNLYLNCGATTATVNSGTLTTGGSGAITTINANGGTLNPYSAGTITTLNINGASVNFVGSPIPRTVSNLKCNSGTYQHDPAILTITTKTNPDSPVRVNVTAG